MIGTIGLYGLGQAEKVLGKLLQPASSKTGQTSPTGASDQASSAAPMAADQSPGRQFASSTLSTLISAQESAQTPPSAADRAQAIIAQGDTNGDGALSSDEITSLLGSSSTLGSDAISSALSKLDTNGDGKLDASELTTGLQQMRQAHGGHHHHHPGGTKDVSSTDLASSLLGTADANGDGELSADEIGAQLSSAGVTMASSDLTAAISKLDTDGDGKLSGAELAAAIDALRQAHQGQAHHNPANPTQTASTTAAAATTTSTSQAA